MPEKVRILPAFSQAWMGGPEADLGFEGGILVLLMSWFTLYEDSTEWGCISNIDINCTWFSPFIKVIC